MRNPEIEAAIDEARKHGSTVLRVDTRGPHVRVYLSTSAGERFVVCAATPSDIAGADIVRAKVRAALGVAFGRKTVGQRRQRQHKAAATCSPAVIAEPLAAVRPDPFAALARLVATQDANL